MDASMHCHNNVMSVTRGAITPSYFILKLSWTNGKWERRCVSLIMKSRKGYHWMFFFIGHFLDDIDAVSFVCQWCPSNPTWRQVWPFVLKMCRKILSFFKLNIMPHMA